MHHQIDENEVDVSDNTRIDDDTANTQHEANNSNNSNSKINDKKENSHMEGCKRFLHAYKTWFIVLLVGTAILLLGVICVPIKAYIIKAEITKKIILLNNSASETYKMWQNPTIPMYLQVYVFHVTNPDDVLLGLKPRVEERGPYTYREQREKVDVVDNRNGTISYRQITKYFFAPELSVGSDADMFTTLNLPIVTVFDYLRWENSTFGNFLKFITKNLPLMTEHSVQEIVFGYKDDLLTLAKLLRPSRFYTDICGIMAGRNNSDDGLYTIFTGETDIDKLGVIEKYNGSSSLSFWTSSYANMINGTDGTLCPPFVTKEKVTHMFSTDVCRSLYGIYYGQLRSKDGITLYKFRAPREALANTTENAGFCTPAGNCMADGVLNISTCQMLDGFHVPIMVSFPHFYMADSQYKVAIDGLAYDSVQYATEVDIEPNTGLVMQIHKRLQINMFISAIPGIKQTANLQPTVFPILWVNESARIDDDSANKVKHELLYPMSIMKLTVTFVIAIGASVMFASLCVLLHKSRLNKDNGSVKTVNSQPDEHTPLLSN